MSKGWLKSLERLRAYVTREGNALVSNGYVTEDGYKLGAWVIHQRHKYRKGRLSREQEETLEQVPGWVWSTRKDSRGYVSEAWLKGLVRLGDYVEREGHARVPQAYLTKDGYKLGTWVRDQRYQHKKGKLSSHEEEALTQLPGWVWDGRKRRDRGMSRGWLKSLERLREYVGRAGSVLVPYTYVTEDGYKLGTWVRVQRYQHNKGRLLREQEEALEQLPGWVWSSQRRGGQSATRWFEAFDSLREYVKREGHARVPSNYVTKDNHKLRAWVNRQRVAYRQRKLNHEQQEVLEDLVGWVWNARDARWPEAFRRLREFVEHQGHASVPSNYVTDDGHKLGKWVIKQRHAYRYGKLSAERQKALGRVPGWRWSGSSGRAKIE